MSTLTTKQYRAAQAKARARAAADPTLIPHGTASGYSYWGCRCEVCTAGNTERLRGVRARARRRAAAAGSAR